MKRSIFFYKELTPAEVGKTSTHEVYIRLSNDFDYGTFFNNSAIQKDSVIEVKFTATDITEGGSSLVDLRFVYYVNNKNPEKRIPSLSNLFKKHNIQEGDIACLEKRECNSKEAYFIQFYKKGTITISPSSIYFIRTEDVPILFQSRSFQDYPLQQIFYGAPGTGKSHKVNKLTKGCSVIRTTFHPDSDYASFVGAYKPTMEEVDMKVIPVVVAHGISLDPSKGVYKENRITYKFVKQAFLKAYLAAWKKVCAPSAPPKIKPIISGSAVVIILSVGNSNLKYRKTEKITKKQVQRTWKKLWKGGVFHIPTGPQPGESVQQAISNWIYSNYPGCTANDFDNGWKQLLTEIENKEVVEVSTSKPGSQTYELSLSKDNDTIMFSTEVPKDKDRIRNCYDGTEQPKGVEKDIIERLKQYGNEGFDDAWDKLKKEVDGINPISGDDAPDPQFLIIEEINRGNCAQIFGDIFQLLDRSDNGFSTYPIEVDTDIQKAIADAFKSEPEYQLSCDINVEGAVKNYTSNYGKTLSEDIQTGRVMLLPPNLYIWATMNTSDQSLFPIDSAFKRRWEWEYLPIGYKNENWIIKIGNKKYKWVDFQRTINDKIYSIDNSEDKQLGDYFVNAERTGNEISSDTLLNKILFYIWNDVCKDDPDQIFRWKDDKDNNHEKSIRFSDFFCNERDRKLQGFMSFLGIVAEGESEKNNGPESPKDPEESGTSDISAEKDNDVNS